MQITNILGRCIPDSTRKLSNNPNSEIGLCSNQTPNQAEKPGPESEAHTWAGQRNMVATKGSRPGRRQGNRRRADGSRLD
jgi:hypothetical protein